MNRIYVVLLLAFISSCSAMSHKSCSGVYALDDGMGWYKDQLQAAREKPLCVTPSANTEQFRFTWLRTFHNPIVINLSRFGGKYVVKAVRLDGYGGYEPGKIVENHSKSLTEQEYRKFSSLFENLEFSKLKTLKQLNEEAIENNGDLVIGFDGAQWIFEYSNNQYAHSIDRWSLDGGPLREIAIYLLEKSGININGPIY